MKPRFESVPSLENVEQKFESLSPNEKFEIVLKLFGSAKAKDVFIETCKEYADLRNAAPADALGENYEPRQKRTYSPPRRANIHNRIMETLKQLSLQRLDPLSQKVLFEMASRETAGKIIKEWSLTSNHEEDETVRKRNDMSGPTYLSFPRKRTLNNMRAVVYRQYERMGCV